MIVMEYQQERFALNKFCEFNDREIEAEFMEYEKIASLRIIRFMALLMGFIFALFIISDYYYFGNAEAFFITLGLRGLALVITIITFFTVGSFKRFNHTLLMMTLIELLVYALYLQKLYHYRDTHPSIQFMTIILFVLTVFLIPNLWKNCIIASTAILVSYILFTSIFGNPTEMPSLAQRGIYLGVCIVACSIFLFGRENSRRKQFAAEKHLEFISITDRLTGIYNRGRFEFVLGQWIKSMRHYPFSLILYDIDNFKNVNDHFGHAAGDEVLVATTKAVSASIRDNDIFARWGGEEFVVLFNGAGIEKAAELAERLRKAVEANPCGPAGKITISIGVAQYHKDEAVADFVNRADAKMYEAKRAGKNRVVADYSAENETDN